MYNFQNEQDIMAEFDRISAEPIDNEPYSLVHNPKPVVESVLDFNGTKVDTGSWTTGDGVTEDKKKVGKAKTAKDPKLTKETPKTTKGEKKDDGKIVEKVDASEKKDDGKTTEVKTATEVKDGNTPKASTGAFDKAAKSAKTSQESGAKSNKKFARGCDIQTRVKMFKEGVKSLAIDDKTKADAEKVIKEFDKISEKYFMPALEAVKYSYGEGKSITVDDGKITEVIGSNSLAKCKGAGIKVKQGEQGKDLTADIEVNGKWLGWNSHAPVTSVEDDGAGAANDGAGAADEDENSFENQMKKKQEAKRAAKEAEKASQEERKNARRNAVIGVRYYKDKYGVEAALKSIDSIFDKAGLDSLSDDAKVKPDWEKMKTSGEFVVVLSDDIKMNYGEGESLAKRLNEANSKEDSVIETIKVYPVAPGVYKSYADRATYPL